MTREFDLAECSGDSGSDLKKSPKELTTIAEVRAALDAIQLRETTISASLASLVASKEPVSQSLVRLSALLPKFASVYEDASSLSSRVDATAAIARRISNRVSSLDEEMKRVKDSVERVSQVMELKSSLQLLRSAMDSKDYDAATRNCARAMSIPSSVISGRFAESVIPTPDVPLPPVENIQTSRETLLEIFRIEFRKAAGGRDAVSASRFFKLFPVIGWEDEGLEVYSEFVVDLLRSRPPITIKTSSPLYYITAITALLEHVAHIIDQHHPVVEKHYGIGKMKIVALSILEECDRVIKRLLDGWGEERAIKRKLNDIATWNLSEPSPRGASYQPEDAIDVRELDRVISEAIGMSSRWILFEHFLFDRLILTGEDGIDQEKLSTIRSEDPLINTGLRLRIDQLLISIYLPLETWYLRYIINRAHKMFNVDPSNLKPVSTVPDDVFYALKFILARMLSSGNADFVKTGLSGIRTTMDQFFVEKYKQKLDGAYIQDSHVGTRGEKLERESRLMFITHLNDLETSASHMEQLLKDIQDPVGNLNSFLETEVPAVVGQLNFFNDVSRKLRAIVRTGIEQLFGQLTRPRLRQFIPELFKDLSYVLTEDSYASSESQGIFTRRFIKAWELQVDVYQKTLTESNYEQFFNLVLDTILRPWERHVLSMKFNELGAIRLDRDIRSVMTYLASQTAFGRSREKFRRLQHISTLLNLDMEDDVEEFYSSSGVVWSLSMQEARNIVLLRV